MCCVCYVLLCVAVVVVVVAVVGRLVCVLGGARLFLFRETPAQFAVYKSPEQGLNLSRS